MSDRKRIGLREVRALAANSYVWDSAVIGFGARRQRSDAVTYMVMRRNAEGRMLRVTIGRHGSPWTPDTARDEARRLLGALANGANPTRERREARQASTVAELCDLYLADAKAGRLITRRRTPKKASTVATDEGRVEHHIKPLLGRMSVRSVTRDNIESFMHAVAEGRTAKSLPSGRLRGITLVAGGRGTATRTTGLLGSIFTYAVRKRMREDNPCVGVTRFADGKRLRRMSDQEYGWLGDGLRAAADGVWPPAVAATRFLALTGWRSGEVIGLTWADVSLDRRTAVLPDTKTGRSARPLSTAACDVIAALPRSGALVFQAARGVGPMSGFPSYFARIAILGGVPPDVTPHVLRHSFASVAADMGLSDSTIATLLGHARSSVTSQYMHHADAVLLAAADAVAARIETLMG